MHITELDHRDAVLQAMYECQQIGRQKFLARHSFAEAARYHLYEEGYLYDPEAIVAAAFKIQFPGHPVPPFSEEQAPGAANDVLRRMGFVVIDSQPTSADMERCWRLAVWSHLNAVGEAESLAPATVREYKAYYGARGIWVDKARTGTLASSGATVSVLHTGRHYPDEFDGASAIYHYPTTQRPGHDAAEVAATKSSAELGLPIFVITPDPNNSQRRAIQLGWVEGWDDASRIFLLNLRSTPLPHIYRTDESDLEAFELVGHTRRRAERNVVIRPSQPRFKLRVFQRYGPRCPLSGIAVPEMIDAAHLRPVADDGSDDPRNGLPLNAALHRAFDAGLFAIQPETLDVVLRPQGPTLTQLGIHTPHLRDLRAKPHVDAVRWRYDRWSGG